MSFLRIAGAALNQTPIDWENNSRNIIEAIGQARKEKIDILCLPELCISGYGCEDLFLSEWVPARAMEELLRLKEYCDGITVSLGLPLRFNGSLYNVACLIRDKRILGCTAKQFLANDGVHYETRWFTPWKATQKDRIVLGGGEYNFGDLIYEVHGIKVAYEICEDAWRPYDVRPGTRHCKNNVQLILNPSASHFSFGKSKIRYDLIIGSSEKFNCTYLYADLVGNEAGRIIYDGEVLIARNGKLIQRNDRLSFKNVNLVSAEVDFSTGQTSKDALIHDEREKNYEFWEATSLGLFDYVRKSRSKGFVLSLSGGADSSACAIMVNEMVKQAVKELGAEEFIRKTGVEIKMQELKGFSEKDQIKKLMNKILICAYQGTENSGTATLNSARKLAESIGASFYEWKIDHEVDSYSSEVEKILGRKLDWKTDDIAMQNIQARARAPIIWMLANIHNALLITTSNRSEGDVGYTTMDGDTAGSIAPIAGVDKHFIQNWLIWAEKNLDQPGLRYVNSLIPTAELRPAENTQTDEKDLMPYSILAQIEREAIRNHHSPSEVFKVLKAQNLEDETLLKEHIRKFFRLWARNQWKRERIAPSFHLDDFNVDPRSWCRFPILSGGFASELDNL
ncbi:MAG TPA: NAD(+) synthase [Cytophagaceae bacterium]|jgi:NAD+ synthase (glutamine-hydrolysing)|nr:NAD(+) synthase [Cytophagaceae bacterium]